MKARYLYAWFVLLAVAVINGALRESTYGKHVSELLAHQLSCVTGIFLFGVVFYLYVRRWPFASGRQALCVGLFWMALTVAFEFLFFHYVGGHSWAILRANYDLSAGRLWPLILLWVGFAPYFFNRFRL
ncbi:MAG: hypothetical protein A2061_09230 [Gallionellales bacterium GWA2_59_43]|nr:MAG: hypothetical protein A2061_09230 [Gallionellales bacterium GWA2_59_43]